jgi:hypothetical protein
MNVDIEIYVTNIVKFFNENPKDLLNLIPENKKEEFFEKIREEAIVNFEKGEEISLTQQQLIDICVVLNGKVPKSELIDKCLVRTNFGIYSLN